MGIKSSEKIYWALAQTPYSHIIMSYYSLFLGMFLFGCKGGFKSILTGGALLKPVLEWSHFLSFLNSSYLYTIFCLPLWNSSCGSTHWESVHPPALLLDFLLSTKFKRYLGLGPEGRGQVGGIYKFEIIEHWPGLNMFLWMKVVPCVWNLFDIFQAFSFAAKIRTNLPNKPSWTCLQ